MFANAEAVVFYEANFASDPYSGQSGEVDWDNPITVMTDAAAVEPIASDEPLQDGRQSVIVGYRLYFDHIVDVERTWRCEVRGEVWSVQGRPAQWRSPFSSWEPGTVVQVGGTDA